MKRCPRCNSNLIKTKSIEGSESTFWLECSNQYCGAMVDTFKPYSMQHNFAKDPSIIKGVFGGFGCHEPNAKILMYDGSVKKAKEIKVGDKLMGPDSTPRKVLETHSGYDRMYKVSFDSRPLVFDSSHILHLEYNGEYSSPTIKEYLKKPKDYKLKHKWVFTKGIEFKEKECNVSPYVMGLSIGDKIYQNKTIPEVYKINSKEVRRRFLAGVLDSKRSFKLRFKNKNISEDIAFIAKSLGIEVLEVKKKGYHQIKLMGPELDKIPFSTIIKRKDKKKHFEKFRIRKAKRKGKYFGFSVDKDNLYVEAEHFSVIHNSGKSIAVIKDVQKHLFITPKAYVAVIGSAYNLIERNFKKDFDEDFPIKFMKGSSLQKDFGYNAKDRLYTLKNGAQIQLITSDNVENIRGLNATKVVLLEASNLPFELFDSVKSRIRNNAASVFKKDKDGNLVYRLDENSNQRVPIIEYAWQNITLESNPENNWIKSNLLLESSKIQFYGSSYRKYNYKLDNINDDYSLHISATDGNPYLPPNYLEMNTRGKPHWEVERFYFGSFEFSENMVLPEAVTTYVDDYPINFYDPNIFVIIGFDYGIYDPAAFVFTAEDFKKNLLITYLAVGGTDMSVGEQAALLRKHLSAIPDGKLLYLPQMDGKSYGKRQADGRTIGEMFRDVGLLFDGSFEMPIIRITKLKSLIKNNQVQIFRSGAAALIEEINGYKWQVNKRGEVIEKPVDKNDHYISAWGFSTIKLPMNLESKKILDYIKPGEKIKADLGGPKKEVTYTEEQKFNRAMDPLNMGYKEKEYEKHMNDLEIDDIIKKLSGI